MSCMLVKSCKLDVIFLKLKIWDVLKYVLGTL